MLPSVAAVLIFVLGVSHELTPAAWLTLPNDGFCASTLAYEPRTHTLFAACAQSGKRKKLMSATAKKVTPAMYCEGWRRVDEWAGMGRAIEVAARHIVESCTVRLTVQSPAPQPSPKENASYSILTCVA